MQIIKIHGFNIGFNELWTCWKKRRFLKSLRGEGGREGGKMEQFMVLLKSI
jgi:hypothetical protein